jgi:O-antigen/teichoic acid export membrane protein
MRITKTKKQLIVNTLSGWLSLGLRLTIALVMVPFLIENLGKNGYGLIGLMGVILSFSSLADMGLRQALGRELSERVANNDPDGFRTLSSTAFILYMCIATVLIIPTLIAAPWFVRYFNVDYSLQPQAILMIRVYGSVSLFIAFITPVFKAGLQSFMRFDAVNYVTSISGIITGGILFLSIKFTELSPLLIWVLVMLLMSTLSLALLFLLYKKWCYSGVINFKYIDAKSLHPLFKLGWYMYVLQLTNALAERSDPLIISRFFGTVGVALYNSGSRLTSILRPMILTFSSQVHPLTTKYHVNNNKDKQKATLVLGTRYTLLLGVFVSTGVILFAEPFSKLWLYQSLGSDYSIVTQVMQLWAAVNLLDYAGSMHWPLLLGMKRMRFALAVQVPSAILNIAISIYFVRYTDYGIPGVLAGTIVLAVLKRPIVILYISRLIGLSVREYIAKAYIPPFAMMLALICYKYALNRQAIGKWSSLALSLSIFTLYASFLTILIERKLVLHLFRRWRHNESIFKE